MSFVDNKEKAIRIFIENVLHGYVTNESGRDIYGFYKKILRWLDESTDKQERMMLTDELFKEIIFYRLAGVFKGSFQVGLNKEEEVES